MLEIYIPQTQDDADALPQYAAECNARVCWLLLNGASFGSATHDEITVAVVYAGATFNVAPPTLPPTRRTVYDAIGNLPTHALLGEDFPGQWEPFDALPNGWDVATFRAYSPDVDPGLDFGPNWKRLVWGVGATGDPGLWLHPDEPRTLAGCELDALRASTLPDWLEQLRQAFGSWGAADYATRYNAAVGRWDGSNTPGEFSKTFDLREYLPADYSPCPYSSHRVFNIHNGKLINSWQQIAAFRGIHWEG
jgi:hypothetical protein